jgi:hypothetical protein
VRNDQAALPNDHVVRNVNEVVDASASANLGAPVSPLINASVRPDVHVTLDQHALLMVAVLACSILERVVSEAWLPNASVRSNDAAFTDRDVWPDVNTREDDG